MSLMDTIKGAREEAGASNPFERPSKDAKNVDAQGAANADGGQSGQGFVRKSVGRAKPSRKAAEGVRMETASGKPKSKKDLTKEEMKAERKHSREVDDLRYNVTQKLLEEKPEYKAARKNWWRFLIGGLVFMVLAIIQYGIVSAQGSSAPTWLAITSMGCMVISYIVLIIGIIYDWRIIHPMRRDVESYVKSMSERRLVTAIHKAPKTK